MLVAGPRRAEPIGLKKRHAGSLEEDRVEAGGGARQRADAVRDGRRDVRGSYQRVQPAGELRATCLSSLGQRSVFVRCGM